MMMPPQMPMGAPPQMAQQGGPAPHEQPAQSPAGQLPPQLLWMLAGAGLPQFMKAMQSMQKGPNPSAGQPHKPGMSIGAGRTPGQTSMSPSFLQQLAQHQQQAQQAGAQPPEGSQPNQLAMLAAAMGGGGR